MRSCSVLSDKAHLVFSVWVIRPKYRGTGFSSFRAHAPAEWKPRDVSTEQRQADRRDVGSPFRRAGKDLENLFEEEMFVVRGILLCRILKDPGDLVLDVSPKR
jgi:hypothetical protein